MTDPTVSLRPLTHEEVRVLDRALGALVDLAAGTTVDVAPTAVVAALQHAVDVAKHEIAPLSSPEAPPATVPHVSDLAEMQMESGVSLFTGEPFVLLRCIDKDGSVMVATIPTGDARAQGGVLFECAEAAEQDVALLGFLKAKLDIDHERAGLVVRDLRDFRHDQKENPDG